MLRAFLSAILPHTDDEGELVLVGPRAISKLTILVITRGPHVAIVLQHHAVPTGSNGLDIACKHTRLSHSVHINNRLDSTGNHVSAVAIWPGLG